MGPQANLILATGVNSYLRTVTASSTLDLRDSGTSSMCSSSELSISNNMPEEGGEKRRGWGDVTKGVAWWY